MKTILLIALIGFTAIGGYAQNKNCPCKHKTSYHKVTPANTSACQPMATGKWTRGYVFTEAKEEPCFQYRQHNIVVTECPGTFYDNLDINGLTGYETESSYMGYYPQQNGTTVNCKVAPEHITIDNYKGVAPAGGNGCNEDCTSW